MPPLFCEQHIEKRLVRSTRRLYQTFVDFSVIIDRADDVRIALDDLLRLLIPDLIRNQHKFSLICVPEHDIQNGMEAITSASLPFSFLLNLLRSVNCSGDRYLVSRL